MSGLIRMALTLQQGSTLVAFRKSMVAELDEKIVFIQGHPPVHCAQYQQWVLRVHRLLSSQRVQTSHSHHVISGKPDGVLQIQASEG